METVNWYKIKEFSEKTGVHHNTIYSWFDKLEKMRIHYVTRMENGMKIFDDTDVKIVQFIKTKRETTFNLEGAMIALTEQDQIELREIPKDIDDKQEVLSIGQLKEITYQEIEKSLNEKIEMFLSQERKRSQKELQDLQETIQKMQRLLPGSPEENEKIKKQEKEEYESKIYNSFLLGEKIKKELKEEALKEWEKKPEPERMKKVGFFRKEEDYQKKEDFVEKFIDDKLEERLKNKLEEKEIN